MYSEAESVSSQQANALSEADDIPYSVGLAVEDLMSREGAAGQRL